MNEHKDINGHDGYMPENNQENSTENKAGEGSPAQENVPFVAENYTSDTNNTHNTEDALKTPHVFFADELETPEEDVPNKKRKKKKKKGGIKGPIIFVSIVVIISALLAGSILMVSTEILGIGRSDEIVQVEIPKGASIADIAQILKEKKVIKFPTVFKYIASKEEKPFYYGIFTMNKGISYSEIFGKLQDHSELENTIKFTIIEGDTLYTIAKKLEKKGLSTIKGFANVANQAQFGYHFEQYISDDKLKFNRVEGYLFPDTYQLSTDMETEDIVKMFFGNFDSKITDSMYARMEELGWSLEETITLASIVQAEADDPKQMKKVAGVYVNRLNHPDQFPRLESDPTRKYVENNIKPYSETKNPDMNYAYNTYQGKGLPPGPICNPGLDAINAVLYPEQHDYYYFCNNVSKGEYFYAKTLAEHNQNLVKAGIK